MPTVLDEIESEPPQADLSASDSPPTVKSSSRSQLLMELHEKEQQNPLFGHSSDGDHGEPNRVLNSGEPFETGGTRTSGGVQGDSSSNNFAHEDTDIEMGSAHNADRVRGRLTPAILGDPLFEVIIQGAFSLMGYKKSNGASPAKDLVLYLLVFVYVLGFLSALGGKLFRNSTMGGIAMVAAALGFLMTMALVMM